MFNFRIFKKFLNTNILLLLVVATLSGSTFYFYREFSSTKADPINAAQAETDRLLAKVSQLIVLPSDEAPVIATVSNPDELKDQEFFSNAKIGDKVLIYTNTKKAILYDPEAHIILNVAPVNIGQNLDEGDGLNQPEEGEELIVPEDEEISEEEDPEE